MNPERWEQMKGLFATALEKEPSKRTEFLREACGQDDELRAELENLLVSYEANKSISDQPAVESRVINQKIGPYQLVRQIGVGGMGAVYLALRADEAFQKRVAIKLVRAGVDTQAVLRRFRQERQILAPLDHPNIAKLLDGGTTDDGLPYFVMDYVEGVRIDQYCDTRKLSINERIALFRSVCGAVQYIHQNLVIHRDLKPGNVLVTADGTPKLVDFGIAKLLKPELDALDVTQTEFRPMTPGYASPEQIRGEPITTVSDVYSLGVILYELLTSCRPYKLKGDNPDEIRQAVCEQEPEKPSTTLIKFDSTRAAGRDKSITAESIAALRATVPEKLRRQLAGDLDNIVMKALRKEPQRRYSSAAQLSEDLGRYLEGLPVQAHKDTRAYRAEKFVRRHKLGVAAATLLALSLIGGVVGTTWQMRVARRERARAEQQFNDVRQLTTSFLFEFHNAIQNLPGSTPARQLLVQRALEYLSKLASQSQGDAKLQRELAEAYLKVGDVQGNPYGANLGDRQGAASSYEKALEISQALARSHPNESDTQEYLARSYRSLGEVLAQLGRPNDAVTDLRHAISILEPLTAARPDVELRFQLSNSYEALADLLGHAGLQNLADPAGAVENYKKALAVNDSILAKDPARQRFRMNGAILQLRIGDMQADSDDLKDAMASYRAALDSIEGFAATDPTNARTSLVLEHAYRKIAGLEEELGDKKTATATYLKAISIAQELTKADPGNVQASMELVILFRERGDLEWSSRNRNDAISDYQRAAQLLEKISAADSENVMARGRLGEMLVILGQAQSEVGSASGRSNTIRGLSITRELASRADATADELSGYATNFLECEPAELREPATALKYAKESIAKGGKGAEYLDVLARAYFMSGDVAQATATEEQALAILPPSDPKQRAAPMRSRIEGQLAKFKAARH
ncbi:MAG TPA: protein kinase [Candidatus Sulfotelmatobacter sp.]|nr:protein kinase [Candidatus Sulfotelmatobacter sp.]